MGKEIERKFLVTDNSYRASGISHLLKQGYVQNTGTKAVRVRISDDKGFLTIKGQSSGITRLEYEYEIPLIDAQEMLVNLCEPHIIEKRRYIAEHCGHTWEIDEFEGGNAGLVVAEIELESESEEFEKPAWAGLEVSDDPKYLNANLSKKPFSTW